MLIKEPHLLCIGGGDGIDATKPKTYGIRVEALYETNWAYQNEWNINDFDFLGKPEEIKDSLGIDDAEYDRLAMIMTGLIQAGD